jgi:ubiquinone/menaquinone biosynthesis C-methylase UbiE
MYYDSIAPGYNQLYELEQKEKLRELSLLIQTKYPDKFTLQPSVKVLDVGCGTGVSSDFWYEKYGCVVTGIDPSKGLVAQNKKNQSTLIIASAESIPFADKSFDLVVSITAIQNFTNVLQGLQEIKRVGNGKFILTVLKKAPNIDDITRNIHTVFRVGSQTTITKDAVFFIY